MRSETSQPRLMKIMAVLFLLAPFGNLLLSLLLTDQPLQGMADVGALLGGVAWIDWLWLGLMFVSGLLLLVYHKTAWLMAVLTLFLVIALNVTSLLEPEGSGLMAATQEIQILFSIFLSFSVLMVLFYARYPYIDRRQGWLRNRADRHNVRVPARLVADEIYQGETQSLSTTGCRIELGRPWGRADRIRFVEVAFPDCEGVRIKAQVVGAEDMSIRLKFREFIIGHRAEFEKWVESQAQGPV